MARNMYSAIRPPPYVHVPYRDFEPSVSLSDLGVIRGKLPPAAQRHTA